MTLQDLIEGAGFTRSNFAREMDTTQASVYNWCSGKHNPSVESVERIANALGVSILSVYSALTDSNPGDVQQFQFSVECNIEEYYIIEELSERERAERMLRE